MDDSKLGESTEGFGGKQVTRAWLSLILSGAWADHYAEAAMYLRLNGVLPPTAKKWSDAPICKAVNVETEIRAK